MLQKSSNILKCNIFHKIKLYIKCFSPGQVLLQFGHIPKSHNLSNRMLFHCVNKNEIY